MSRFQSYSNDPKQTVVVPTDDFIVRCQLRDLNQPMSFFAEGPAERRERLKHELTKLNTAERQKLQESYEKKTTQVKESDETFYYEGPEGLIKARYDIATYSLRRANLRLDLARFNQLEPLSARLINQQDIIENVRKISDRGTFIDNDASSADLKTFTSCNFNDKSTLLVTSSRSGQCKLWSLDNLEEPKLTYYKEHQKITSAANFIAFSPKSGNGLDADVANLASCYMDGSIDLWNLTDGKAVSKLSGPKEWRVTRVRYHPCGSYLASCCSDHSWRLWDLATESEILHQEGHGDAVFDIAFHPDGSLAGSAGMDSYGIIWDLRTGHSIHTLSGHTKGIRSIDFSPNGYQMATGGMDNTVRIWDLRKRNSEYTIPAHLNIVTSVLFEKKDGHYLVTSSFDKTVKFWSNRTWAPVNTLDTFDDKVSRIDLSSNSELMVSCHYKILKLWALDNGEN